MILGMIIFVVIMVAVGIVVNSKRGNDNDT